MPFRVPSALGLSLCVALSAAAGACARPETTADRQLSAMREQVTRMQSDHDKVEQRLGALELAANDEKRPRADLAAAAAVPTSTLPPARVVHLGGSSDAESADPNAPGERPDIRLTGAGSSRPRSGKTGGRARIEETKVQGLGFDASRSTALDPEAKNAYEAALAQVQSKQYDRGLEGLSAFLVRWPGHPYAENALYWRGEAYFGKGEYLRAAEQFEGVLARFGGGNKGPDALLKLGLCHERLGASSRAREYWDRLKNEFPRSDAAKRIPARRRESSRKGPKENR